MECLLLDLQLHVLEDLGLHTDGDQNQDTHDDGLPVDRNAVQVSENGVDESATFKVLESTETIEPVDSLQSVKAVENQ